MGFTPDDLMQSAACPFTVRRLLPLTRWSGSMTRYRPDTLCARRFAGSSYPLRVAGRFLALALGSEGRVIGNTSRTCSVHIWQNAVA